MSEKNLAQVEKALLVSFPPGLLLGRHPMRLPRPRGRKA